MSHHKPDPNKNINLTINGIPVTVPEGTRILEAARKVNVKIPTLCDHPDLCRRAVCRLCVVECDGRGKLVAACANDVSEGLSVVTHNARIIETRKTIIEMILADHPNDCLNCVRNRNCELQTLAADFGIREIPFERDDTAYKRPSADAGVLVRDMDKCVKCGRCVDACQNSQTIKAINSSGRGSHYAINTPYAHSLAGGTCVFCGHCAAICPVGALYGNDQSGNVWAAMKNGNHVAARIAPGTAAAFNEALGLPAGTVSAGKIASAMKQLGFAKIFNGEITDSAAERENGELLNRIENGGKLPMITGCSSGSYKFVEEFYPALADHLTPYESAAQVFHSRITAANSSAGGTENARVTTVSVEPCLAQKFNRAKSDSQPDGNLILTAVELAGMFRFAGINAAALPEIPFDTFDGASGAEEKPESQTNSLPAIEEIELPVNGAKRKMLLVRGYANARAVMDSIAKGECRADWVKIIACPPTAGNHCPANTHSLFGE